jgi:hypothetical protein
MHKEKLKKPSSLRPLEKKAPQQGYLADIKKQLVSISLIVATLAGCSVYVYLEKIGWPELMFTALGSRTALGIIFTSLAILFIGCAITFYGSAYWIGTVAHSYEKPNQIPPKLWKQILFLHLFWNMECGVYFYGVKWSKQEKYLWWEKAAISVSEHFWITVAVLFVAAVGSSIYLHNDFFRTAIEGKISRFKTAIKILARFSWDAFQLLTVSLCSSLAMLAFIAINPKIGASEINLETTALVLLSTWPGILLGLFYLVIYQRKGKAHESLKVTAKFTAALTFYFFAVFPNQTMVPINFAALSAAGVFSQKQHTYAILKPDWVPLYQRIGFELTSDAPIVLKGYERFHLGDALLLCSQPYSPLTSPAIANPPKEKPSKQKPDMRSKDGCISVEKAELRRIDLPV